MSPPVHFDRRRAAAKRDARGLGVFDEGICLRLLADQPLGRLGFTASALPVIFPINFFLDDRTVYFRSEIGQKTTAADHYSVACLEVDEYNGLDHSGWSVLATGRLSLPPPDRADAFDRLPVRPWAIIGPSRLIQMSVELISGRFTDLGRSHARDVR